MTVLKVSFLQALGHGDPLIFLASEVLNQKMHIGSDTAMRKSDDLFSFHSYNKNGYVSSFFREGKEACWKTPKAPKSSFTCAELSLSADAPENATLHSLRSLTTPFKEKTITPL